jgi:hypothetical protein
MAAAGPAARRWLYSKKGRKFFNCRFPTFDTFSSAESIDFNFFCCSVKTPARRRDFLKASNVPRNIKVKAVVLLHKPDKPPPKCDFLIKLDQMHSLLAHFQDLSKDHTLVMVCVLELTKTQTTLAYMCCFVSFP